MIAELRETSERAIPSGSAFAFATALAWCASSVFVVIITSPSLS